LIVRHRLLLIVLAAALVPVQPAGAQFGTIFGGPPRPPGDIPQGGPPGDDRYFSAQPPQRRVWPREPQVLSAPAKARFGMHGEMPIPIRRSPCRHAI
jgi:hypothetical protein